MYVNKQMLKKLANKCKKLRNIKKNKCKHTKKLN